MKRRSFLKSAAGFLPAAGLDPMAFASLPSADAPKESVVIGAGKDRLGETHSRGYSSILFKVLPRETSNGLFVIEHMNLVNGGPPLHKHLHQEEYFYLISGEVRFAVGDQRLTLHRRRLDSWTARHPAYVCGGGGKAKRHADFVFAGREDGGVSAGYGGTASAGAGRRVLQAIRDGTGGAVAFRRLSAAGRGANYCGNIHRRLGVKAVCGLHWCRMNTRAFRHAKGESR